MKFKRLIISLVINTIIIILGITAYIELIVRMGFFRHFRYFTIDGNLFSVICSILLIINQIKAIKISSTKNPQNLIISHFLYILGLMSACTESIIFIVVFFILMPFAGENCLSLINNYHNSIYHVIIPLLVIFRFLFLDVRERDLSLFQKLFGGIPMFIYGLTMLFLCIFKVFTGYGKEGDGRIPYPFLDVYHRNIIFCLFSIIFIIAFGFGIGFLFDFINKKCENLIYPYLLKEDNEEVNQIMEMV
jgi:hypothetical protein